MVQASAPTNQLTKASDSAKTPARSRDSATDSPELVAFLQMDPEERFDIEAINSIDSQALLQETQGNKRVLREVLRTAEALLPRVRAETEDPILVSAILRNKTLDWYRRSTSDPKWPEIAPIRWGGIFHESRVPGGRLSRKLSSRLTNLVNDCIEASGAVAFLRAGVTGIFRGSAMMAKMVQFSLGSKRPRFTQQVAQAYLDDLASGPRVGDNSLPLERLSGVARRNGSTEVNITLSELFLHEAAGIFIVVDPRFHPGMKALSIRVVAPKTPDDSSTYDLVQGASYSPKDGGPSEASPESQSGSLWERSDVAKPEWLSLFKALEKRKARLEAPPRENPRERDSYLGLKELLLTDASARKAFLKVHWKGRPSGLPLLCRLLVDGTLTPEVETDGDYLEAELDHPEKGRAERRPKEGQWNLGHGWTVVREFSEGGRVRTYKARANSAD